jgi:hypothetical protein
LWRSRAFPFSVRDSERSDTEPVPETRRNVVRIGRPRSGGLSALIPEAKGNHGHLCPSTSKSVRPNITGRTPNGADESSAKEICDERCRRAWTNEHSCHASATLLKSLPRGRVAHGLALSSSPATAESVPLRRCTCTAGIPASARLMPRTAALLSAATVLAAVERRSDDHAAGGTLVPRGFLPARSPMKRGGPVAPPAHPRAHDVSCHSQDRMPAKRLTVHEGPHGHDQASRSCGRSS